MNKEQDQNTHPNNHTRAHINIDGIQRNSGRDYYENITLGSIKTLLLCAPKALLDRIALDNSRMFEYRFGFETSRTIRRQILAIQNRYDFTDKQIRGFRVSGTLKITHKEAKLAPSRLALAAGWAQVWILSLYSMVMLYLVGYSLPPTPKQLQALVLLGGFWLIMAWMLNKLYIASWYIAKQAGVPLAFRRRILNAAGQDRYKE
ncbi:MAG: hypothetical protein WC657_03575 [Candidatus Paceibacterota bacterium]|jgi:hypothetical protein|uniref:hypothetical protein n=1 Tax=Methylomonas montana TaxID=3058963 RepID=UPI002657D85E|nr:hypothetical protein [Methylomonas montana]WKJ90222.1 hypothetical protein QZJ86_19755 [Methylomonas montana]